MMYSYNSTHKIITALAIVALVVYHYSTRENPKLTYSNGNPIRTGITENNLSEGLWIWYYENGKKQLSGNFHKGKREGEWLVYDTAGNVVLKSMYRNNLLNGEQISYDAHGNILQINYYENDKLVEKNTIQSRE